MTCHMYQHRWLVIHVSFPERCWRGFCWLPKGWLLRNEPLLCRFHTQSTEHYNLSLQWVEPLVPGMHNQWQESPSKHRRLFFFQLMNHENERSKLLFWWNCHDYDVACSKCGWTLFVFMTSLDVGVFCLSVLLLKRQRTCVLKYI